MIDLMSDGRLELGVGRGFQPVEYRGFAVDQSKSREIFEEALQVIVQAWTEDRVSFKGAHFDIPEHSVRPMPMQKPHPPIWVAAVSDDTFALAGDSGFNLLCSLVYGFKSDYTALLLSTIAIACESTGTILPSVRSERSAWSTVPNRPTKLARTSAARFSGTSAPSRTT